MRVTIILSLLLVTFSYGCKTKPSNDEIKKCILKDFLCGQSAKINSLTIINSSEREFMGIKGYEFIVEGEIEWTSDCQAGIMGPVQAGYKQTFANKKVFVRKMDNGWTCE